MCVRYNIIIYIGLPVLVGLYYKHILDIIKLVQFIRKYDLIIYRLAKPCACWLILEPLTPDNGVQLYNISDP